MLYINRIVVAVALATLGAPQIAAADCTTQLTAPATEQVRELPPACRSLGPIHLGMSRTELLAVMGPPDQWVTSGPYDGAVYVFPRNVNAIEQKLFKIVIHFHFDTRGVIQVLLADDRVVSIYVTSPSRPGIPFTVGNIGLGQPIDPVLEQIQTTPRWNDTKDDALFAPYPIGIQIDPTSRRIRSITIATTTIQ